jgi:hypothetical protein
VGTLLLTGLEVQVIHLAQVQRKVMQVEIATLLVQVAEAVQVE